MQQFEFLPNHGCNLAITQSCQNQLGQGCAQLLAERIFFDTARTPGRDDCTGTMADCQQPLLLQLAVGDGDRVQVDAKISRHLPDRREQKANGNSPRIENGLSLVNSLQSRTADRQRGSCGFDCPFC